MDNTFATFDPIELKSSPDKEDIAKYYLDNNITTDNDFLDSYLGLTKPATVDYQPSAGPTVQPATKVPKYDIRAIMDGMAYKSVPAPITSIASDASNDVKGKYVMDYFVNKGLTKEQAAGIAGNIHAESGFNLGAIGDNGTSYGLVQWHGPRWDNFKAYAKRNDKNESAIDTQLDFIWHELKTTESRALTGLRNAKTVSESARVFAHLFERMKKYSPKREQYATYHYSKK